MAVNSNWIKKAVPDHVFSKIVNEFSFYNINTGPWIAGGAVRKMWQGLPWTDGDIDIFFKNEIQYKIFKNSLTKKCSNGIYSPSKNIFSFSDIKSLLGYDLRSNVYAAPYVTKNASTFSFSGLHNLSSVRVQAICKAYYESAEELFQDFDWTVCQFVSDGTYMWATPPAVDDLSKMNLEMSSLTKRKLKLNRIIKYSAYGFNINDEIMLNSLNDILTGNFESIDNDDY